jgi:glycosyltransferase involved in cell wall biosynthesis
VRGNDWGVIDPPSTADFTPRRSVSVVVPAYRAAATLPYTLAALSEQTYPSHLLEVVVIDDGDGHPLALPELRPENLRVIRAEGSWGRSHACHVGASVAKGDVIHWLDADMVPARDQVATQLRWHHALDHAVVLGHKLFVDDDDLPPVAEVHAAAASGDLAALFADRVVGEHEWVDRIWERTDDLRGAGFRAFHVHVGSTASVGRDLYLDSGGMDPELKLGEDIELGYRLAMKGAVFIAERSASNWHLGRSHLMRHQEQVQRYNAPFIAQRVPDFRKFRRDSGRLYRVPLVEAVVEVGSHGFEDVAFSVDGILAGRPQDIKCRLVGPWSLLHDERRTPLWDPHLDLRLLQEEYAGEPRVDLVEKVESSAFPAQFRLLLPAGWQPGQRTIERMVRVMQRRSQGLRCVRLADGQVVRVERTAAFERARRLGPSGAVDGDLDGLVDEVSETSLTSGDDEGFHSRVAAAHDEASAERAPSLRHLSDAAPSRRRRLADLASSLLRRHAGKD